VGDSLWTGKPPIQPVPALCAGWNEYLAKVGGVNRRNAWYTSPYMWSRSVRWCLAGGWLAEISTDLREAVAHLRRDATMRYTKTPILYFISLVSQLFTIYTRIKTDLHNPPTEFGKIFCRKLWSLTGFILGLWKRCNVTPCHCKKRGRAMPWTYKKGVATPWMCNQSLIKPSGFYSIRCSTFTQTPKRSKEIDSPLSVKYLLKRKQTSNDDWRI